MGRSNQAPAAAGVRASGATDPALLLNPSQQRHLRIVLLTVERALFDFDHLMDRGEHRGILWHLKDDLEPERRATLQELAEDTRERLRELRDRFRLEPEEASLCRRLVGSLAILWADLEDTRAHRLRAYGEVAPGLPEQLDPLVDDLIRLVLTMDRSVRLRRTGQAARESVRQR